LFSDRGPCTAEGALIEIVEAAVFSRGEPFDLGFGEIVIGQTAPDLTIRTRDLGGTPIIFRYRPSQMRPPRDEVRVYFHLPIPIVRDISRAIILRG
jgi:hypothetical protein